MADPVVLDTSACFAVLEDEPGANVVEGHLQDAILGRTNLHGSFVTLTEIEYIITQERGNENAEAALLMVKSWPVRWHHSDEAACSAAARLKAAHRISFADSFVASLAQSLDATLVHKDPEFKPLTGVVKQQMLPAKGLAS